MDELSGTAIVELLPARRLYAKSASHRGPCGSYVENPNSVFMTRYL